MQYLSCENYQKQDKFYNIQFILQESMPGKKWCEYCRINLPFSKKQIQEHESSKNHIRNKDKHIKYERLKLIKQQKQKKQQNKPLLSSANIPKAQRGSQLEKQVEQFKDSVIRNGKMAIHQLIAEQTQGLYGAPIQYPKKQELVLAENYISEGEDKDENSQESDEKFEMWKIDVCQTNGQPCFINKITKLKLYEPPKGYILSEQQKQLWEELKRQFQQMPEYNGEEAGQIGGWQEDVSDDYFQKNQVEDSEQQPEIPENNPIKKENFPKKQETVQSKQQQCIKQQAKQKPRIIKTNWLQDLQDKVNRNEVNQEQVFGTMVNNTLSECRNIKQKNETLKKLVKHDIEIHKNLDSQLEEELNSQSMKKKGGGFSLKPRKKVKTAEGLFNENNLV